MRKISVFIDGGPFMDGIRYQGMSLDMDLMAMARELVSGDELQEVHFFVPEYPPHPYPTKHQNEKTRLDRFRSQGIQVHLCRTQVIGSVFVERGVEAALATHMICDAYADRFDAALIISQRPDIAPVIKAVKDHGKSVEVAFFHYDIAPVNPLDTLCDARKVITPDQVLKHWKSGPRPVL